MYFNAFFDSKSRSQEDFAARMQGTYLNIAKLGTQGNGIAELQVSCNFNENMCKRGFIAHMDSAHRMNFCPPWFSTDSTSRFRPTR